MKILLLRLIVTFILVIFLNENSTSQINCYIYSIMINAIFILCMLILCIDLLCLRLLILNHSKPLEFSFHVIEDYVSIVKQEICLVKN